MYSHVPEYDIQTVNNRFAEKTYTPGNGLQIAVDSGSKLVSRVKALFATKSQPSGISYIQARPQRVTYVDIVKK